MKMTNLKMVECINQLTDLINDGPDLRVRLSQQINRNYGKLLEAYKPYEDDLQKINNSDASDADKNSQIQELMQIEIEIPVLVVRLTEIENEPLNLKQMHALEFMVEDTE